MELPTSTALVCLRSWPLPAQQQRLLEAYLRQPDAVLLFTEDALTYWLSNPALFDTIHAPSYALQGEVSELASDKIPAFILQLSDTAWLELTLKSQPVLNLG